MNPRTTKGENTMANTNCLEGIACPKCRADDAFYIEALVELRVTDDGTEDEGGDHIWSEDSPCRCAACDHHGEVSDFTVENWPATSIAKEQAAVATPQTLLAEMLDTISSALYALNTAPRFPVGDTDSYKIAALCERTIAKAKKAPAPLADPLAAAAPELLAALEKALPFIPHEAKGAKDVLHPTLTQARAAIAKAKGGAS
jgi:hypothetical protein